MDKKNAGLPKGWEKSLEDFFAKLPQLPANFREIIVKYGPWVLAARLILAVPALLAALGLGVGLLPMAGLGYGGYGYGFWVWIYAAILGVAVWALPGLFKRQKYAWRVMFYLTLGMGVASLLSLSLGSLILGTGLSLYVLFQIKSYYK